MSKHNYEVGGRVQISGKWYDLSECSGGLYIEGAHGDNGDLVFKAVEQFVQAYEPPKKAIVHEWLDSRNMSEAVGDMFGQYSIAQRDSLNKKLTLLYGAPPIVRTYNGEEAEEFGLKPSYPVFYWSGEWIDIEFGELDLGDKWMIQPPAPKEDE